MSLSHAIVAVLSLTTPDVCSSAGELAGDIARARDLGVPLITALNIVQTNPLWTQVTAIIYSYPDVPPAALAVMIEGACRDNM